MYFFSLYRSATGAADRDSKLSSGKMEEKYFYSLRNNPIQQKVMLTGI
jgi:hypothetical protein